MTLVSKASSEDTKAAHLSKAAGFVTGKALKTYLTAVPHGNNSSMLTKF